MKSLAATVREHRPMIAKVDKSNAHYVWIYCSCGWNKHPHDHSTIPRDWPEHVLAAVGAEALEKKKKREPFREFLRSI